MTTSLGLSTLSSYILGSNRAIQVLKVVFIFSYLIEEPCVLVEYNLRKPNLLISKILIKVAVNPTP